MTVKLRPIARIDGDAFLRAVKIHGIEDAELGITIEIKVGDAAIACESIEDAIACLEAVRSGAKSAGNDNG